MDSTVGSPHGSISLRPEAQPSGSTAQLGPAAPANEPATVEQSVTQWLHEQNAADPHLPGTPHSVAATVPSPSPSTTARRAIDFQDPVLTPANSNVQNTTVPPSGQPSVAPSQTSSKSEINQALQERNLELERQLAEALLQRQQQADKIQRLEEIAHQMQTFMQSTTPAQSVLQAHPAVIVQPSVTVGRINPRAQTRVTPAAVSSTVTRTVRATPLVQHVAAPTQPLEVPMSPAFPSLPTVSTAPVMHNTLPPSVPTMPVSFAATVQPSLIPVASTVPQQNVPSQPAVHTSIPSMQHVPAVSMPVQHTIPVVPSIPQQHQHIPTQPAASHVSISSTPAVHAQPTVSYNLPASDLVQEIAKLCRGNENAGNSDRGP
jgi:hypothetical protein